MRTSSAVLAFLAILPIASAAASSITSERESEHLDEPGNDAPHSPRGHSRQAVLCDLVRCWLGIGLLSISAQGSSWCAIHPLGLLAWNRGPVEFSLAHFGDRRHGVDPRPEHEARSSSPRCMVFVFVMTSGWLGVFGNSRILSRMRFMLTGETLAGYSRSNLVVPPLAVALIAVVNLSLAVPSLSCRSGAVDGGGAVDHGLKPPFPLKRQHRARCTSNNHHGVSPR